jgi:hypothetical protein
MIPPDAQTIKARPSRQWVDARGQPDVHPSRSNGVEADYLWDLTDLRSVRASLSRPDDRTKGAGASSGEPRLAVLESAWVPEHHAGNGMRGRQGRALRSSRLPPVRPPIMGVERIFAGQERVRLPSPEPCAQVRILLRAPRIDQRMSTVEQQVIERQDIRLARRLYDLGQEHCRQAGRCATGGSGRCRPAGTASRNPGRASRIDVTPAHRARRVHSSAADSACAGRIKAAPNTESLRLIRVTETV